MNLIKTSVLTFIATVIKMLSGLVINKAISVFIGPSGLAVIGQFQNALGVIQTAARGGLNSGITKYTAEYHEDEETRSRLWSTSLKLTLSFCIPVSLVLLFGASYISEYIFKTDEYSYVLIIFGFTLVLFSLNQMLLSILNGLKEIKTFVSINIIQSLYSLIFTTLLIVFFHLDGALIAMVTNQSVIFLVVLWKLKGHKILFLDSFKNKFSSEQSKKLLQYSFMALVSAFTAPMALMIIRNHIGNALSWEEAGYWQAMTYISSMYLMVITTALSTYYLPRLSEIKEKPELRKELKQGYLIIIPLVITLSVIIFFLKDIIIWILFTPDFKPMLDLFKWQLIGDVIKMASWLLGYILLARAEIRAVVISEVLLACTYVFLSISLVDTYGLIGISYAYAINCFLHFLYMGFYCFKKVLY